MDWHAKNIDTYNTSAQELSEYFNGIGSRVDDIERALTLLDTHELVRAVEIGCGDGRDATEIIKRVNRYEGFDPSKGLLEIAKAKNADGSFVIADALSYNYPGDIDVIFAFASLLHVNKDDLAEVFKKAADSLKTGGIFYISLKERPDYTQEVKTDAYGQRMFYFYNVPLLQTLARSVFTTVFEDHQTIGSTNWLTIALKKT